MPRYKDYSYSQTKMISISFDKQIIEGTFEYVLIDLIDNHLNLDIFHKKIKNDATGAPAFEPTLLLKIILYAYSRGITSSRTIAQACNENVIFMALSADTHPHYTTIAHFISSMEEEIQKLFLEVLLVCDDMELISRDMFAIDGCKLPSNAAKEWSGTRKDFERKKEKFEKTISHIIGKHNRQDQREKKDGTTKSQEKKHLNHLKNKVKKIQKWLDNNDDKQGKRGAIIKSNITDNESAKMLTSHGVIQGYTNVVASDEKHQVVVYAESFGVAQEHDLLQPAVEGIKKNMEQLGKDTKLSVILADSGFSSIKNLEYLEANKVDAYVPDHLFRKRDPRYAKAEYYRKPVHKPTSRKRYFAPSDFTVDLKKEECICPAGTKLFVKNRNFIDAKGMKAIAFMAPAHVCPTCPLKAKCLRNQNTPARQVYIFYDKQKVTHNPLAQKMITKIDTDKGRYIYSQRMGIVEPVFANICCNKGLNRMSLRGKIKVTIQWLLYCIVHNIGKIFNYGYQVA